MARNHNEWFRTVNLGGRKSCPRCGNKLAAGESVWCWGEYIAGKWRNVLHFCRDCFPMEVANRLETHAKQCGCTITLVGYRGEHLPDWLRLETDNGNPCPVCGEQITIVGKTTDGRLIGSCRDAFTESQWAS